MRLPSFARLDTEGGCPYMVRGDPNNLW